MYTGQNGQLQPKPTVDSLGRSSWTPEEDARLTELVKKHGVGNWQTIGTEFKSSRSFDSLRHRWTKLEKHAAAAVPATTTDGAAGASDAVVPKVEEGTAVDKTASNAGSGSASAAGGWTTGPRDALGRALWTAAEDANLVELVKKHGAGNWDPIEEEFYTSRSADALRKRWYEASGAFVLAALARTCIYSIVSKFWPAEASCASGCVAGYTGQSYRLRRAPLETQTVARCPRRSTDLASVCQARTK